VQFAEPATAKMVQIPVQAGVTGAVQQTSTGVRSFRLREMAVKAYPAMSRVIAPGTRQNVRRSANAARQPGNGQRRSASVGSGVLSVQPGTRRSSQEGRKEGMRSRQRRETNKPNAVKNPTNQRKPAGRNVRRTQACSSGRGNPAGSAYQVRCKEAARRRAGRRRPQAATRTKTSRTSRRYIRVIWEAALNKRHVPELATEPRKNPLSS